MNFLVMRSMQRGATPRPRHCSASPYIAQHQGDIRLPLALAFYIPFNCFLLAFSGPTHHVLHHVFPPHPILGEFLDPETIEYMKKTSRRPVSSSMPRLLFPVLGFVTGDLS